MLDVFASGLVVMGHAVPASEEAVVDRRAFGSLSILREIEEPS